MNALWLVALALTLQQEAPEVPSDEVEEPIEEITAYAGESMTALRVRLRAVDEKFFDRYNELNTNDDFDMVCKLETRIGSQLPRRVCLSKLHRRMAAEDATDFAQDIVDGTNNAIMDDSPSFNRKHYNKVRENIRKVLNEDEELRSIVRDRQALLAAIKERLEE